MDFLAWLKMKLSPTLEERVNGAYDNKTFGKAKPKKENKAAEKGVPSWLDALYKSPLADSLYQTSGVPRHLGVVNRDQYPDANGTFNPDFDSLKIEANKYRLLNPRRTFIHEMGHRYANENRSLYGKEAAYKPNNLEDITSAIYTKNRPKSKATLNIDSYYATDPKEAYAQAFKNAFNFLSETARDPKMDYRKFAGDLEANTPGMGMIVEDLLKLPLYQNHPLRGQIFTTKPKKK